MGDRLRRELKSCAANLVSDCGLRTTDINSLEGNPAGTSKSDYVNPNYVGKISERKDEIHINLTYSLSGSTSRAKAAVKNIQSVFKTQKVIVNFVENQQRYDLLIHGATIGDLATGLKACECNDMLRIGGWGPHHTHFKWGNALLVNPHSHRSYWKMSDAHEFGHKLGLRHRQDMGIMAYWNERTHRSDPRKFLPSDRARIVNLYIKRPT